MVYDLSFNNLRWVFIDVFRVIHHYDKGYTRSRILQFTITIVLFVTFNLYENKHAQNTDCLWRMQQNFLYCGCKQNVFCRRFLSIYQYIGIGYQVVEYAIL